MIFSDKRFPLCLLIFWLVATLIWWGIAFIPVNSGNAEWLLVARDVCFGVSESGLPDASGWLMLTLAPISFLVALWVIWPSELQEGLGRLLQTRVGRVFILVIVSVIGLETYWVSEKMRFALASERFDYRSSIVEDLPSHYPTMDLEAKDFTLIDQFGNQVQLSDFFAKGKVVFLTFAFAHCQTVCPALVFEMKKALRELDSKNVEFLLVTLDPWRDTPAQLPSIAERWKLPENGRVLSGDVDSVMAVLDDYDVYSKRSDTTGDIDHPALVYVLTSEGRIVYRFNNAPSKWMVQAFHRLQERL